MGVARSSFVATVLVLVVFAPASVALAAGRVALVVGNSNYDHIGRLPNPENDAVDMAGALARLGFDVTTELDADRVALTEALRAFTRRSAGADVSLVFYAGHGIEMDGTNYVVPVDARLARHRRARRDGDAGRPAGVDDGGVVAAGAAGRVPEQPARAVDAADGGDAHGERGQLRGPERGPAGGRDAGGVRGRGEDDGGGRPGAEQPVHGGAADAPNNGAFASWIGDSC